MNAEIQPAPSTSMLPAAPPGQPGPALAVLPAHANPVQPAQVTPRKCRRNGRIARLGRRERELVNRMLFDGVPYLRIVAALEDHEIFVTQRNISNWKTRGGYDEWRAEHNLALEHRLQQDNLVGLVRSDNPTQLSEVGVQALAAALSRWLTRPESLRQLCDDPAKLRAVTANLCQLNRELRALQKYRDSYASFRHRSQEAEIEEEFEQTRTIFSSKTPPENPNALPPRPPRRSDVLWPPKPGAVPKPATRPAAASPSNPVSPSAPASSPTPDAPPKNGAAVPPDQPAENGPAPHLLDFGEFTPR